MVDDFVAILDLFVECGEFVSVILEMVEGDGGVGVHHIYVGVVVTGDGVADCFAEGADGEGLLGIDPAHAYGVACVESALKSAFFGAGEDVGLDGEEMFAFVGVVLESWGVFVFGDPFVAECFGVDEVV